MGTTSSFFGGGGGAECCPQYIFLSTDTWCPAVAGDVIVHAIGGGSGGCTATSDCIFGGGAGGYTHKCISVAPGQCYCFIVASTYYGSATCACAISGSALSLCASHGGNLDIGCRVCDAGMGYGGDVNYCGGKGGYYTTQGTKYCTSMGGAVTIFGCQSNGTACCRACADVKGASVRFGDGTYVSGELKGTNSIHPSVTYLKNLNWGDQVGVGGWQGILSGNAGLFASSSYANCSCGCCNVALATVGRGAGNWHDPVTLSVNPSPGTCGVIIVEYLNVS